MLLLSPLVAEAVLPGVMRCIGYMLSRLPQQFGDRGRESRSRVAPKHRRSRPESVEEYRKRRRHRRKSRRSTAYEAAHLEQERMIDDVSDHAGAQAVSRALKRRRRVDTALPAELSIIEKELKDIPSGDSSAEEELRELLDRIRWVSRRCRLS